MKIERFEDIEAWQLARVLTRKVYDLTKKPKFANDFGLKRQIQDAAGSSMHNIAEGFDSETNPEFQDVYDHVIHVIDTIETNRDLVSGVLDIYMSGVSNKMNTSRGIRLWTTHLKRRMGISWFLKL